jgi:hypothetical protein
MATKMNEDISKIHVWRDYSTLSNVTVMSVAEYNMADKNYIHSLLSNNNNTLMSRSTRHPHSYKALRTNHDLHDAIFFLIRGCENR